MGGGASMATESGMDEALAERLAGACAPQLAKKGLPAIAAVEGVTVQHMQGLWTGMGAIDELVVEGSGGARCSVVVKHIGTPKDLDNFEYKRDHDSYHVEACFYERGHADRLCAAGAPCPRMLLMDRKTAGVLRICMTKLTGEDFSGASEVQVRSALEWLAALHAAYWGDARADEAVDSGLQPQGCYWHFDTRQKEMGEMASDGVDGRHKLAAAGLDARLKADAMQTVCHGDPKAPNIMYSADEGASFFDFQWIGKAPVSKDLAYFMACAASGITEATEEQYLRHYFAKLCALLQAQGDEQPSFESLRDSYALACADLARWMAGWGWWGNKALLKRHVDAVLDRLDGGAALASAEEYRRRVFQHFPPGAPLKTSAKPRPAAKAPAKAAAGRGAGAAAAASRSPARGSAGRGAVAQPKARGSSKPRR